MMRNCVTCGVELKNRTKINGVYKNISNRTKCLSCLPFGQKTPASSTNRKARSVRARYDAYKAKYGIDPIAVCRGGRRSAVLASVGHACSVCGYSEHDAALAFHHLSGKESNTSAREFQSSPEKILAEVNKCVVVCHNCHSIIHASGSISVGSPPVERYATHDRFYAFYTLAIKHKSDARLVDAEYTPKVDFKRYFFLHEWESPRTRAIIESMISHKRVIGARKCTVGTGGDPFKFMSDNHLFGPKSVSQTIVSLSGDDGVLAMATFIDHGDKWELDRFASKLGIVVQGGFSRIIKHITSLDMKPITTFAEKRLCNGGDVYKNNGFKVVGETARGYGYVKDGKRLSRVKCQKHKLGSLLAAFDEDRSEAENMAANGYTKFYDSGHLKLLYLP